MKYLPITVLDSDLLQTLGLSTDITGPAAQAVASYRLELTVALAAELKETREKLLQEQAKNSRLLVGLDQPLRLLSDLAKSK